eukprot:GEMP01052037.1.p1 GENE.GEMP01052037.1~~GEMP01052037.1.p1  ORF type:complete len:402 (+),score=85.33 GEMP01052037.1:48-1253(+)
MVEYVELEPRPRWHIEKKLVATFIASCVVVGVFAMSGAFHAETAPAQRKATFSAVSDGKLIIFAGRGRNGAVLDDIWTYSGKWEKHTGKNAKTWPSGRFNGCFLTAVDKLMLFGGDEQFYGLNKPNFTSMSNEVWTFDFDEGWSHKYPLHNAGPWALKRSAPSCGYIPQQQVLYVYGGRNADNKVTNNLWRVNFVKQEGVLVKMKEFADTKYFPARVKGACAVSPSAYSGNVEYEKDGFAVILYVHGGRKGNQYNDALSELSVNRKGKYRWRQIVTKVIPSSRNHHGCTWSPNTMWIFGGRSSHKVGKSMGLFNDVWRFDTRTEQWSEVPKVSEWPEPRFLPSLQYNRDTGKIFIFGGQTARGKVNDLWEIRNGTKMVQLQPCIDCHMKKLKKHHFSEDDE